MSSLEREKEISQYCEQLQEAFRQGNQRPADTLIQGNPSLAEDVEAVLELVYAEVILREEAGESVAIEELTDRFPEFAHRLKRLFAVHDALQHQNASISDTTYIASVDTQVYPDHETAPRSIDAYQLDEVLGQGGMGVVYKARHRSLDRLVAIKLVRTELSQGESGEKLINEAKTVAKLEHRHIVQIYDAGTDGQAFICFEYMENGSLDSLLARATLEGKAAAKMMLGLADAIQYAHDQGVIHRDLKPGNILLGNDRTAKIADFGLAKSIWPQGDIQRIAKAGAIHGSLRYMAPEQVRGDEAVIGTRTDVYGLGTVLYEMLVGRPPFVRNSPLDTAMDIQRRPPTSPRVLESSIPVDLETICLKCLEKSPQRRYASAANLRQDLQNFLDGKPIEAKPASKWSRFKRTVATHPVACIALAAATIGPTTVAFVEHHRAKQAVAANERLRQHFDTTFLDVTRVTSSLAEVGYGDVEAIHSLKLETVDYGLQVLDDLAGQHPNSPELLLAKAQHLRLRGLLLDDIGQHEQSMHSYAKSIECFETLFEIEPDNAPARHYYAVTTAEIAQRYYQIGDADNALVYTKRAAGYFDTLSRAHPDNQAIRLDRAWVHSQELKLSQELHGPLDIASLEIKLAKIEEGVKGLPESTRVSLIACQGDKLSAELSSADGKIVTAMDQFQRVSDRLEQLAAQQPTDRNVRLAQISTKSSWARAAIDAGQLETAERVLLEAIGIAGHHDFIELQYRCRCLQVSVLVRTDQMDAAKSELKKLSYENQSSHVRTYHLAATWADVAGVADRLAEENSLKREASDRALDLLEKAVAAGFHFTPKTKRDRRWDSVRTDSRFEKAIQVTEAS